MLTDLVRNNTAKEGKAAVDCGRICSQLLASLEMTTTKQVVGKGRWTDVISLSKMSITQKHHLVAKRLPIRHRLRSLTIQLTLKHHFLEPKRPKSPKLKPPSSKNRRIRNIEIWSLQEGSYQIENLHPVHCTMLILNGFRSTSIVPAQVTMMLMSNLERKPKLGSLVTVRAAISASRQRT